MADRRKRKAQPIRRNPAEPIGAPQPIAPVEGIPPDLLDFLVGLRGAGPQVAPGLGGFEGPLPGFSPSPPGFLPGETIGQPIAYPGGGGPLRRPFPGMGGGGPVDPGFNIRPDPPGFFPGEELGPMRPIAPPGLQVAPGLGGFEGPLRGPPMRGFPRRGGRVPHPGSYGGGFPGRRPF